MHIGKLLAGFVLRFALIYAMFLIAWTPISTMYRATYRTAGNIAFCGTGLTTVRFEPSPNRTKVVQRTAKDVAITLRTPSAKGKVATSSYYSAYIPTAVVCALVLATPVSMSRRARTLCLAFLLVHAFITLRLALLLLSAFSEQGAMSALSVGSLGHETLYFLADIVAVPIVKSFVAPVMIWGFLTLRPAQLRSMIRCEVHTMGERSQGLAGR